MKAFIYLMAATMLVSFSKREEEEIDGIWMGYYRSDISKEKVIVKFSSHDRMEFYAGGVDEGPKCIGSYRIVGDSVSFTYRNAEGKEFNMEGTLNYRKTYVDGTWKTNDLNSGKFYLEKQKIEERIVQP
jgi:hypothetical protein